MKNIKSTLFLILITLLFNGCSSEIANDEDAVLIQQIQGKWKLTESYSNDQMANTPISNGYEIEFKADRTFISNEENGYSKGTYTVQKILGKNLRLIYHKNWSAKQVYKYINSVDDQHIYLEASTQEPTLENQNFPAGYILTRIP